MTTTPPPAVLDTALIAQSAALCAEEHIEQGWDFDGEPYHLGNFPSDVDDLRLLLGRDPTRDERLALEAAIRESLAAAKTRRDEQELASAEAKASALFEDR